mmetsp:Transcript_19949/g.46866  ORF Transcript_19949/g.46866 Transcript_19949/m.46866 type:complete len:275 (+) Transcript_19949:516-1340(+)
MRSGSWQLRTVPEREPHELEQPEHGEGLPAGHRTGAGGTLLGEDGAGRAAHIGRDTGVDTEGGRDAGLALLEDVGRRRRGGDEREGRAAPGGVHRRTGGDARRHREHALRRGAPPAPGEPRLQEPVHSARLVGARHGRPGGAEDEADAAQRQVDDADGTPAGLFVLPRFRTAGGLDQVETVTVHVRAGERDHKPPRRVEYIQGAPHDDRAERPLDAPPASTPGTVQEGGGLLVAPRRGAHVDRGERRHRGLEGAGGQRRRAGVGVHDRRRGEVH